MSINWIPQRNFRGGSNIPESQNFLNVLPLYETEMSKEYGVPIGYKYWEKNSGRTR